MFSMADFINANHNYNRNSQKNDQYYDQEITSHITSFCAKVVGKAIKFQKDELFYQMTILEPNLEILNKREADFFK